MWNHYHVCCLCFFITWLENLKWRTTFLLGVEALISSWCDVLVSWIWLYQVQVKCSLIYMDFEGRSDGRSIKSILSHVAPLKLVRMHFVFVNLQFPQLVFILFQLRLRFWSLYSLDPLFIYNIPLLAIVVSPWSCACILHVLLLLGCYCYCCVTRSCACYCKLSCLFFDT